MMNKVQGFTGNRKSGNVMLRIASFLFVAVFASTFAIAPLILLANPQDAKERLTAQLQPEPIPPAPIPSPPAEPIPPAPVPAPPAQPIPPAPVPPNKEGGKLDKPAPHKPDAPGPGKLLPGEKHKPAPRPESPPAPPLPANPPQ